MVATLNMAATALDTSNKLPEEASLWLSIPLVSKFIDVPLHSISISPGILPFLRYFHYCRFIGLCGILWHSVVLVWIDMYIYVLHI